MCRESGGRFGLSFSYLSPQIFYFLFVKNFWQWGKLGTHLGTHWAELVTKYGLNWWCPSSHPVVGGQREIETKPPKWAPAPLHWSHVPRVSLHGSGCRTSSRALLEQCGHTHAHNEPNSIAFPLGPEKIKTLWKSLCLRKKASLLCLALLQLSLLISLISFLSHFKP